MLLPHTHTVIGVRIFMEFRFQKLMFLESTFPQYCEECVCTKETDLTLKTDMQSHICNPRAQEAEARGSPMSTSPA